MDAEQVAAEEECLRLQVRELSASARSEFYAQFEPQVKDPDTYAVLNYLFISGLHHFYLGKWRHGVFNLCVFIAAIVFMFNDLLWLGLLLLLAITVAELYSLFRSQLIVQDHNNRVMRKVLSTLGNRP